LESTSFLVSYRPYRHLLPLYLRKPW